MSRPTQSSQIKIIALAAALAVIIGGGVWDIAVHRPPAPAPTAVRSAPITHLTYRGQDGQSALTLLKQHAKITTKTSSLGEFVTSIDGNDGGGKKYWIFYVNGKEAQVGAGDYLTHKGDVIQWKLQ